MPRNLRSVGFWIVGSNYAMGMHVCISCFLCASVTDRSLIYGSHILSVSLSVIKRNNKLYTFNEVGRRGSTEKKNIYHSGRTAKIILLLSIFF